MATESGTGMKIIIGAIILSVLIFIAGLAVAYYWDEIRNPPGNEQSVPAPTTY